MTRRIRRSALAVTAVVALGVLSGCGSSSDDTSADPSSSASATEAPSDTPSDTPSESPSDSPSASASPKSPSASPSASASSQAPAQKIMIKDYAYSGATSVAPGAKITITNADSEAHTVTADAGGAFDVNIAPGKSATLTAPSKPGKYAYHCIYHANMHGTLTVG